MGLPKNAIEAGWRVAWRARLLMDWAFLLRDQEFAKIIQY
jgi:hypothetical protein